MPKILVRPVSYHWHRPLLNVRKSIKPGQLLCLPKVLLTCKNLWFRDLLNQSCHFYIYQCAIGFSGMSLNSCFLNPYNFLRISNILQRGLLQLKHAVGKSIILFALTLSPAGFSSLCPTSCLGSDSKQLFSGHSWFCKFIPPPSSIISCPDWRLKCVLCEYGLFKLSSSAVCLLMLFAFAL